MTLRITVEMDLRIAGAVPPPSQRDDLPALVTAALDRMARRGDMRFHSLLREVEVTAVRQVHDA